MKQMKSALKVLSLVALALSYSSLSFATESMMGAFRFTYPKTVGTRLDGCVTCHSSVRGELLNSYGLAFKAAQYNLGAIENADSDGDKVSNIAEINAGTPPGSKGLKSSEYFTFNKTGPMGIIDFNHRGHQFDEAYGIKGNCAACHKKNEFSRYITDVNSPTHEELKKHATCYRCHLDNQHAGNTNAPIKCHDCHQEP